MSSVAWQTELRCQTNTKQTSLVPGNDVVLPVAPDIHDRGVGEVLPLLQKEEGPLRLADLVQALPVSGGARRTVQNHIALTECTPQQRTKTVPC